MATPTQPVYLTVRQFCAKHAWCKVGGLRYALANAAENGLEACTVRFGRKLLLDEAKVFSWLENRGPSATPLSVAREDHAA